MAVPRDPRPETPCYRNGGHLFITNPQACVMASTGVDWRLSSGHCLVCTVSILFSSVYHCGRVGHGGESSQLGLALSRDYSRGPCRDVCVYVHVSLSHLSSQGGTVEHRIIPWSSGPETQCLEGCAEFNILFNSSTLVLEMHLNL